MFRRTKPADTVESATPVEPGGKGRPTPTRKEAEAAAKARAKAAKDPKSARLAARAERDRRVSSSREIREGIKAGDERYLGRRDLGPVRRFVRDFVDSRLNVAEFTIPLLFSSLIASAAGAVAWGNGIMNATIIVVTLDSAWLVFRLKRELRRRFPGESLKGTTFYALTRALQLRFMRIPKSKVKLGQALPENYK